MYFFLFSPRRLDKKGKSLIRFIATMTVKTGLENAKRKKRNVNPHYGSIFISALPTIIASLCLAKKTKKSPIS